MAPSPGTPEGSQDRMPPQARGGLHLLPSLISSLSFPKLLGPFPITLVPLSLLSTGTAWITQQ